MQTQLAQSRVTSTTVKTVKSKKEKVYMTLDITTPYSRQDLERLQPQLSNWLKTHSYIRQLNNSEKSLIELRKLITIELQNEQRVQMVSRLRSRFVAMRKQLEDELLFSKIA